MALEERIYSALLVSASQTVNGAVQAVLAGCDPVETVADLSAAKRAFAAQAFDLVIINSPLPDDPGLRFAIDLSASGETIVLVLVRAELHAEITARVAPHGVFTLAKPTSRQMLTVALQWMQTARERLRRTEKRTLTLEEKMAEIRLVNRAKWLLIEQRGFAEPEAHRWIEKQAMDRCITRRAVAEELIAAARQEE